MNVERSNTNGSPVIWIAAAFALLVIGGLIIGEAARHLSAGFKQQHASIPWRKITGMRDKLVHDYLGVDLPVVWHTVSIDLPDLEAKLK